MVNIEKTIQSLQKKFKPGEFEKRKIVFWYDEKNTLKEEDFNELTESLEKGNIKFHILDDNYFETKKLLEKDDVDSNYLIYSKEKASVDRSNWLLDIQLYSQTFETSEVSVIKSELEIDTHIFDDFLETHSKFFNNKLRVTSLKSLYQKNWGEEQFILGFLAVLSSLDRLDFNKSLRNIFCNSLDQDENTIYSEIKKYPLEEPFWNLVRQKFGYSSDHPTLDKLFLSLILTHIKNKTTIEFHKSDEEYINKNKNESGIFIQDWMDDPKQSSKYYLYACEFTKRILSKDEILHTDIHSELEKLPINDYIEAESIDIFDKFIIKRIADDLINHKQEYDSYLEWIGRRKQKHWYNKDFKNLYNTLEFAVKLKQFDQVHTKQDKNTLKDLFKSYKETYYQMDYFYRKFYYYLDKDSEKDILKKLQLEIENLYNNKLLDSFLTTWSDAINHELDDTWDIESLDKQSQFFKKYVKKIVDKNDRDKVAVIISDALRYEVAEELKTVLNKETKGTLDLSAMIGVIPSYTKLGMACLLPHESLGYKDDKILVDEINSSGIENRGKILSQAFTDSIAINFEELMSASRDDAREKIKGKRIIYIYHNTIDSIGDDKKSESKVFNAVEETIEDFEKMIRRLSHSLSVTNIIITADHGFIYKREVLDSADKLESITFDKIQTKEAGKRFILSKQDITLKNVHKFKMNYIFENTPEMFIYVPYGDLRFKQKGGGANFVHGGLSPQEIIIPVLSYHHLRDIKTLNKKRIKHGKVKVSVINSSRKITNNAFIVNIFQAEKITDKLLPLKFKIALWDLDEETPIKVSDEKLVIADKTSDKPEERQMKITLTLGAQVKNKKYYLRLIDEDPKALKKEIEQIPFDVDLAISRDFGDI